MPYTSKMYDIGSTRFHVLSQIGRRDTGIFEVEICERGFMPFSQRAIAGPDRLMDIAPMLGHSANEIAEAFEIDPNARLSAKNDILMLPWANRMIGDVIDHKGVPCVKVDFMGQTRYVPTNLDNYRLHGLVYANQYHDAAIQVYEHGISLTGKTEISNDQWFSDLSIIHTVGIFNGVFIRYVDVINTGNNPAPVSIGEHPYFQIPDGQDRAKVTMMIPGNRTILLGDNGNPDFSENPIASVKKSPLAGLFTGEGMLKLGGNSLNNSFLLDPEFNGHSVQAGVQFKEAGYGVFISAAHNSSVNVLHAFAPLGTPHPADGNAVALEFQGNYLAPLDEHWEMFSPLLGFEGLHPSGMWILNPGKSMKWSVTHTVR